MGRLKNKFNNTKDKVAGEVKDKVGKITGNETLELKGKIQSAKSDLKQKINKDTLGNKTHDIKEGIAGKINNMMDKKNK